MRNIEEYKTTTNRSVYNKARKGYLEHSKRLISCSHCRYHRGENDGRKYYGGQVKDRYRHYAVNLIDNVEVDKATASSYITQLNYGVEWEWRKEYVGDLKMDKHPNWKLTSKNRKQWNKSQVRKIDNMFPKLAMCGYSEFFKYKW